MASGSSKSRPLSLSIPSRRSNSSSNFLDNSGENEKGRELFEACRTGDVSRVKALIQNGWPVNMRDTNGRKSTPLHFAAGMSVFGKMID